MTTAASIIRWSVVCLAVPLVSGCGGSLSDYSLKDQEWFSGAGRVFRKDISIEAPPLSPTKPVAPADLVSADGACSDMPPPGAEAQASADGAMPAGPVALGHTECEVVRAVGQPSHVELSSDPQGRRLAVVTYGGGSRSGIYRFTAGRLSSIEALPAPAAPERPRRPRRG